MAAVPVGKKDRERGRQREVERVKRRKREKEKESELTAVRDAVLRAGRPEKVKAFIRPSRSFPLPPSVLLLSSPGHKHQTGKESDPRGRNASFSNLSLCSPTSTNLT